jgi:prepilin-type N-terminal cleavage/methylation domain-containing protein
MKFQRGYTLIEISITLAALFVLLTFCVNLVLRSTQATLIDSLQSLQVELISLQQQALACNESYRINFSPELNSYQIIQSEKSITYHLPQNIIFGLLPNVFGPPSKPEALIRQPVRFENPHPLAAIIHPHGRISSGSVYLMHSSGRAMGALSITPHQVAHVRVYLLENKNSWRLLTT